MTVKIRAPHGVQPRMIFDSSHSINIHNRPSAVRVERPGAAPRKIQLTAAQRNAFALVAAVDALLRSRTWAPEWKAPWCRVGVRTLVTEGAGAGGVYEVHAGCARALEAAGLVKLAGREVAGLIACQQVKLTDDGNALAAALADDVAALALTGGAK